ncbi:MAG: phosphotransferase family protein [Nocardioides sp.]|nr:phosphotransferase family protein [Nocardioides sp.]
MSTAPGDDELDLAALAGYLAEALPGGLAGDLTSRLIAGGRSNPTYELTDGDGDGDWILRRPPYGAVFKGGHDMMRESRVLTALHGSAVPVPHVVTTCEDDRVLGAPFYVMDRIDGRTFRAAEDTATLTPQQRRGLAEALLDPLVALHEIDPADVGLADWGRPDGYLERQLGRWGKQWHAVKTTDRAEVDVLLRRLTASLPATQHPGIVHGDFKIDNIMVDCDDPMNVLGVLDWEMATLGDTLADLGLMLSFWDEAGSASNPITGGATAMEGFPSAAEMIDGYAERRRIAIDDIDWYVVLADFKLAVILEQIHARHLKGETTGDGFEDIGPMVGPMLERGLDRASASTDPALRAD